jgi:hypothetical protein
MFFGVISLAIPDYPASNSFPVKSLFEYPPKSSAGRLYSLPHYALKIEDKPVV